MTPMEPERLAEIRQTHNDMRRHGPISSRIYTADVTDLLAERDSQARERELDAQALRALTDQRDSALATVETLRARLDAGAQDYVRVSGELKATLAQRELALVAGRQFCQERDAALARLDAWSKDFVELRQQRDEATAAQLRADNELKALARQVRSGHLRDGDRCQTCTHHRLGYRSPEPWPCPTVRALDGRGDAPTEPAGPVVVCGSLSQFAELAGVAALYRGGASEVLYPKPSDRPAAELDAQWLAAIEKAALVVVLRKPDGSIGGQAAEELGHALNHGRRVHMLRPASSDAVTHQCPPDGSVLMPCCGLTPFQAPRTDRITADGALVTCSTPDAEDWPHQDCDTCALPDCQRCQGAGRTGECRECDGTGDFQAGIEDNGEFETREPCTPCEGTGLATPCGECDGTGRVPPPASPDTVTTPPTTEEERWSPTTEQAVTTEGRRWPPSENCYCGGPEEIYPHRIGTGRACRHRVTTEGARTDG